MLITDILFHERASLVCSFLGPEAWPHVRNTTTHMSIELSEGLLHRALVDMVTQTTTHLAAVRSPGEDHFHRVQHALRVIVRGRLCGTEFVRESLQDLAKIVVSWIGRGEPKPKMVTVPVENKHVHKRARLLLRGTDPKLWVAAAQACPEMHQSVCRIMSRWPLNYKDRDLLLDANAAVLPKLARVADPVSITAGFQLAVTLSCGCEHRVALLERESLSTRVVEALKRHIDNDDVVIAAMGYLFNVAQCEEQWPTLKLLDIGSYCMKVLHRMPDHAQIQMYAHHILDILHIPGYELG